MKLALILMITFVFTGCGGLHVNSHPFKDSTIFNFQKVDEHVYRGSQPQGTDDYNGLKKLGIKTILNLRNDEMKISRIQAQQFGLVYKHIAMSDTETPRITDVKSAILMITDPINWPIYVHCQAGHARTAIVIATYHVLVYNWNKSEAWKKDAVDFGFFKFNGHAPLERWFLDGFKTEEAWK